MRRTLATLFLLGFSAGAVPAAAAPDRVVSLKAALATCETGATAVERFAVFKASMPRVKRAERMELRFDLLQRRPGDDDFVRLAVPKFGVWERAEPRVSAFLVAKRVNALAAPATYRVLVRFRWFAADGSVLRRSERRSKVCRQPDPRPDLVFDSVSAQETDDPQQARYAVVVRNAGRGDMTSSAGVSLTIGERRFPTRTLSLLASGETDTVSFLAPRCNDATPLELSLDPAGVVEEAGERNNLLSVPCAATLRQR